MSNSFSPLHSGFVAGKSGILFAEYLTVLPPRETLQAKLHDSIERAKVRLPI
jgi:hypothetical protein